MGCCCDFYFRRCCTTAVAPSLRQLHRFALWLALYGKAAVSCSLPIPPAVLTWPCSTALRLRSKDELAGTTRHRRFSAHRCLCARLIVGLTVNGSQYVCALPQCDTMQCYHTVRPRDYHQSQTSLTVCMYCRWSECSAARHTATEF